MDINWDNNKDKKMILYNAYLSITSVLYEFETIQSAVSEEKLSSVASYGSMFALLAFGVDPQIAKKSSSYISKGAKPISKNREEVFEDSHGVFSLYDENILKIKEKNIKPICDIIEDSDYHLLDYIEYITEPRILVEANKIKTKVSRLMYLKSEIEKELKKLKS